MALNKLDEAWMQRALACAAMAVSLSEPNPRVGCVLVDANGAFVAEGHTHVVGGPHAEVVALRAAQVAGLDVRGGTAFVTLEPCSHHGRTPPCAEALVASGLARVVVALLDPNPLVSGQGVVKLRAAGVVVDVLPLEHSLAVAAHELNIGFMSRMERNRPWVRLKAATSLDGRTALSNGHSQWITGTAARTDGHAWRRRASAVLTGIGTVLADNPQLNVRGHTTPKQPIKVVLDTHWCLPLDAALWRDEAGAATVWVYGATPTDADAVQRREALSAAGALVVPVAVAQGGGVALDAVLADLAQRGVNELHVEAGARLNAAFIAGGWVDELLVYIAPKLLGPGRPMADLASLQAVSQAVPWVVQSVAQVGDDVRLILRTPH